MPTHPILLVRGQPYALFSYSIHGVTGYLRPRINVLLSFCSLHGNSPIFRRSFRRLGTKPKTKPGLSPFDKTLSFIRIIQYLGTFAISEKGQSRMSLKRDKAGCPLKGTNRFHFHWGQKDRRTFQFEVVNRL